MVCGADSVGGGVLCCCAVTVCLPRLVVVACCYHELDGQQPPPPLLLAEDHSCCSQREEGGLMLSCSSMSASGGGGGGCCFSYNRSSRHNLCSCRWELLGMAVSVAGRVVSLCCTAAACLLGWWLHLTTSADRRSRHNHHSCRWGSVVGQSVCVCGGPYAVLQQHACRVGGCVVPPTGIEFTTTC